MAGAGDPDKLSPVRGRVIGARPGQRIVLYARVDATWWVQPFANQPFTTIQGNGEWSSSTHPGAYYAALLVGPDFQAPPTVSSLPTDGVLASDVAPGDVTFWHKWWFPVVGLTVVAFAIFGYHRLRLHQMTRALHLRFEERLAERTQVAQELHDTLLQGVVSASMQLHVAVDQLPADSHALPALNRVLQLMGQVVQEGRNTLNGLRTSAESAHDLKRALSRIPQELPDPRPVDFHVIVDGPTLPLQAGIRDEVYNIGREAVVNAFRHSHASKIEVELEYAADQLRVIVRDDGCGIDPTILRANQGGHSGLCGMRERAERMGARLKVWSRKAGGTEVDLRVPGAMAFESRPHTAVSNWLQRLRRGQGSAAGATGRRAD